MTGWHQPPNLEHIDPPTYGAGDVLLRVGGAGVCHSDLHLLYDFGEGAVPWQLPFTLGHENAGWVRAVGAGVVGVQPGQPVAVYGPWGCGSCHACVSGRENYCSGRAAGSPVAGLGGNGGMADLMVVPGLRHLVALPDSLTPIEAAPLTDAGLTPYHAISGARSRLVPGAAAVVIGAGGLGHLAVQILRATTDVTVVAVDTRPGALQLAEQCGADAAVLAGPDAAAAVRDGAHGDPAAVFDMVGSDETLRLAAQLVGPDGWIGIVGLGGGTLPVSLFGLPYGVIVRSTYWGTLPELHEVLALAARGDLVPRITTFPLSRAVEAIEAVAAGSVMGRAVVVPDDLSTEPG